METAITLSFFVRLCWALAQQLASQIVLFISLRQERRPSHVRKLTSTYSMNVILPYQFRFLRSRTIANMPE
ncbi:hypothetical protein SAMN05216330_12527 [Bradyrhizobium sp. Ghvi]|nr:hypothetical protein SAMN05216330_12527 [Bradyrhizobium sp. Ghvi]